MLFQSASAMCSILMPLHIHIYNGIIELRTTDEDQCGLETGKKKNNLCRGPFIVGIFCFFFQALISSTKYKNILYKVLQQLLIFWHSIKAKKLWNARFQGQPGASWLNDWACLVIAARLVRLYVCSISDKRTITNKGSLQLPQPVVLVSLMGCMPNICFVLYVYLNTYCNKFPFLLFVLRRTFTVQMNGTASDFSIFQNFPRRKKSVLNKEI